ncbi:metal-binding protein ZinT [Ureibacillus chungkukjangi]|uniref:Zinc transport system substrate-binding protein n=1 Tax=Ureibacillus chungkukjangi TaxID=1202712 RepID=A0A318TIN0_9BACL|nr:metal-binding protein ZinT [Ureibacillus chungkukjangi]PYF04722.1 zinc transport system substrate-binding protein [Ureibacillus chungkukjangi]
MKAKISWLSILALSAMLVGCAEEETKDNSVEQATTPSEETTTSEEQVHNHDHDHNHSHDEDSKDIYAGYFDDEQVKERELSDWAGDWQSVYPYLQDGTLDEVFEHKAEHDDTKTAEDFKAYYEIGYKTSTDRIVIEGNNVTFYDNGHAHMGEFVYDGYEILTYEKGNRGVRFIYKHTGNEEGVPGYIQFSDHIISPQKSDHFHLYWGDDRAALLDEVENWPTYYPASMDGHTIAHEMMAH